jgi:NADH:ubiquinone reductase (H+-translocating)
MSSSTRPRVLIIGAGFGGLWAARGLARANVDVTVIDRTNHHLFQPLLYQVATAGLAAPSISAPIRHLLRKQKNATVLMAEVSSIDLSSSEVVLHDDARLGFDYLVVAPGATHSYFGNDAWAAFAPGLKTLQDAQKIRAHILGAFEKAERETDPQKQAELLRFVVVGGGPTGVEMAGTLAELARHTLLGEFRNIDLRKAEILLLEGSDHILSAYPRALSESAVRQLQELGVKVALNAQVIGIDASGLDYRRGDAVHRLHTPNIFWGAGVRASPLGASLAQQIPQLQLDRAGRVPILPDLSLPGHSNIFVIGDLASLRIGDVAVPGIAPAAKQMGAHAARNVLQMIRKKTTINFRYRDFGAMATIGRHRAIAVFMGRSLSGALAWWLWLFAHILFLIGFRNRAVVLLDWAGQYWNMQRYARIF